MASVASARPIGLRHKPSPSHAKSSQRPLCASFRSHPPRTITAPHRSRQASIPIAPAAPPAISSRDFVPWRFSDAGRTHAPLDLQSGVRETCTIRPTSWPCEMLLIKAELTRAASGTCRSPANCRRRLCPRRALQSSSTPSFFSTRSGIHKYGRVIEHPATLRRPAFEWMPSR